MYSNLTADEHGIWRATPAEALDYPEDGNTRCFALEDGSFWFRHRNDCIAAAVKRYALDGPVLDVRGGNGVVSKRLIDEGFDPILLEPGPVGALNAKTRRGLPEVICATFESVGFPEASLSAVGLFDVLEHVEDDTALLRRLHHALRPGGLLYVTVPALQALWSAADIHAQHYRRYSRRSLDACLREAGLALEYATYFFGPLLPLLFLLRCLPFRLGLTRSRNVLRAETEHGSKGGRLSQCAAWLLRSEVQKIRQGRGMRAGTSVLAVGRKKGQLGAHAG